MCGGRGLGNLVNDNEDSCMDDKRKGAEKGKGIRDNV